MRALKIQEKAKKVGFDWNNPQDCLDKVNEEYNEFLESIMGGSKQEMEHELGDMLFALINMSRFLKINPDEALRKANSRFLSRFKYIEESLKDREKSFKETTLEELEALWQEAKTMQNGS